MVPNDVAAETDCLSFDVVVCCFIRAEEVCDWIEYLQSVGFLINDHEEDELGHGWEPMFFLVGWQVKYVFHNFRDPECYGF